ncbi:hypothetical protein [Alkalihalobacillus sp. LMS39]|uniref:hypothetical protein n=1 Tax=Alkalihalobacillus sp. LMS39 TaxID=2924032 RepID=UPI001FB1EF3A|nr:hypothetical protein [Alkalihalobacillus sp. LMS39]UOE95115.1 hypothetical protein MM271_05675 [Alkalihalobacillus sp. LMS39]
MVQGFIFYGNDTKVEHEFSVDGYYPLYIGQSDCLRQRIINHLYSKKYRDLVSMVKTIIIEDKTLRMNEEQRLISLLKPIDNKSKDLGYKVCTYKRIERNARKPLEADWIKLIKQKDMSRKIYLIYMEWTNN